MKKSIFILLALCLWITIPMNTYAMHIAEGAISLNWCIFYFVLSTPFIFISVKELKKVIKKNNEIKMLLGLMAAYIFMMSAMKLPSVTGSSSHPTGTGLGSIVFGPIVVVILSVIVLLFQALLLAHGGLTTLGANVLSMGVIGPFIAYGIYKLFKNKNKSLAVFLACALGNLSTYIVTSIQLSLAYPDSVGGVMASAIKFMGVFALTQVPLAIVEGIISIILYDFIEKHCIKELNELEEALL